MSLLTNLLAVLGVVLIILVIIYFYNKAKKTKVITQTGPPAEYMLAVGSKCPDLWTATGTNPDGTIICENTGNLPLNPATKKQCNEWAKSTFQPITKWPVPKKDVDKVMGTRCRWYNFCGPSPGVYSSWTGVGEYC